MRNAWDQKPLGTTPEKSNCMDGVGLCVGEYLCKLKVERSLTSIQPEPLTDPQSLISHCDYQSYLLVIFTVSWIEPFVSESPGIFFLILWIPGSHSRCTKSESISIGIGNLGDLKAYSVGISLLSLALMLWTEMYGLRLDTAFRDVEH